MLLLEPEVDYPLYPLKALSLLFYHVTNSCNKHESDLGLLEDLIGYI